MISNVSIASIALQGIVVVLFVALLFWAVRQRERFSMRPVWVGVLVFFLFSQVLEKIMHLIVLQGQAEPHGLLANPFLFATYGALAAGVFEEAGRYLGFRLLLKRHRQRKDGLAYGLGHGGIEALFIGVVSSVQSLVFAVLINTGKFEQALGAKGPADALADLKSKLLNASPFEFLIGGFERIPALFIQIALSLIVLYSVRSKRIAVLFYAILLHALVDFIPGLYQAYKGNLSLWAAEGAILLFGVAAVWLIWRSRTWRIWSVEQGRL
ncbi:YhfC family intramembrane metalloprotease [Paenibacillus thalictri]|uniref:YhfC family intramembrane metalloprotease n=1 Tax=Paenibacillus thalictri TaxID=2527873 RepID=A0A4Q9DIF5_9BACL|nr:YhfC family intramembrane metalloprotease [Paenibacillus thalictri]TBL70890.1 YhfC family intramembrane metalloprotease [Paenibacillus thalictri]